jgi:hypothetical protein
MEDGMSNVKLVVECLVRSAGFSACVQVPRTDSPFDEIGE